MATDNVAVIRQFCAAWSALDTDRMMTYFSAEPTYHNMPGPPAVGAPAVRGTIERFLGSWQKTDWEVLNVAAAGNVVFAERIDRTDAGGKHVDLPCVGVFEMDGGKIRVWRDYFDLATYTRAMS
ncbi:limonene-1,2-epoxide hydrolase family protein [Candidatus Amarobacter glycogenicus]|uniref:limonene-1,2-epoxide hydrolase family protein n=1 Tax=Candidatus Amarobacter glycogenicus TaxID=3140699 RepID=UPI00313761FF|nr:nuclear transport factor 2 family protein [Dehalococcoidia bacterium]MBK9343054.1 nuclear transport factor 2 family protein [Dehalococcoidia bacterium]MCC6267986.1 nuclear transport factor 2 family protein [Dehalococcoidia bacterium]